MTHQSRPKPTEIPIGTEIDYFTEKQGWVQGKIISWTPNEVKINGKKGASVSRHPNYVRKHVSYTNIEQPTITQKSPFSIPVVDDSFIPEINQDLADEFDVDHNDENEPQVDLSYEEEPQLDPVSVVKQWGVTHNSRTHLGFRVQMDGKALPMSRMKDQPLRKLAHDLGIYNGKRTQLLKSIAALFTNLGRTHIPSVRYSDEEEDIDIPAESSASLDQEPEAKQIHSLYGFLHRPIKCHFERWMSLVVDK